MNAFKSQQHRWAKGSIQTCRKLLPRILRSNLPLHVKAEAFFHLTANFNYPLMVLLSLLMFPSMVRALQHGLDGDDADRHPAVLRGHVRRWRISTWCASASSTRRTGRRASSYAAVPDVDRHRPLHQQRAGRASRRCSTSQRRVHAHAEIRHRARLRRVDEQEVSPVELVIQPADRSWRSASTSRPPCSTRWRTRSTARCRSWCSFQVGFLYTGLLSIVQQFGGDDVALSTQTAGE